jgi:hypothetical protein
MMFHRSVSCVGMAMLLATCYCLQTTTAAAILAEDSVDPLDDTSTTTSITGLRGHRHLATLNYSSYVASSAIFPNPERGFYNPITNTMRDMLCKWEQAEEESLNRTSCLCPSRPVYPFRFSRHGPCGGKVPQRLHTSVKRHGEE